MITQDKLKELLHYDPETGIFTRLVRTSNRINVGEVAGTTSGVYVSIYLEGVPYKAHRLAWLYVFGRWPSNGLDHIDRNTRNNVLSNLRETTQKQNMENTNRSSSNTSGFKGVTWHKVTGKWAAQITHHYKIIHIGVFETIEGAVAARKEMEDKLFTHHIKEA